MTPEQRRAGESEANPTVRCCRHTCIHCNRHYYKVCREGDCFDRLCGECVAEMPPGSDID